MSTYNLAESVNEASENIINSWAKGPVTNPLFIAFIVTAVTVIIYHLYKPLATTEELAKIGAISLIINTCILLLNTKALVKHISSKDGTNKLTQRFNKMSRGGTSMIIDNEEEEFTIHAEEP